MLRLRLAIPEEVRRLVDELDGVRTMARESLLDLRLTRNGCNAPSIGRITCVIQRVDSAVKNVLRYVTEVPAEALVKTTEVIRWAKNARRCLETIETIIALVLNPNPEFIPGGFNRMMYRLEGQIMDLEQALRQMLKWNQ